MLQRPWIFIWPRAGEGHPGGLNRHLKKKNDHHFRFVFGDTCLDISKSMKGKFSCLSKVVCGFKWLRSIVTNQGSHQPPSLRASGPSPPPRHPIDFILSNFFQMESFKTIHFKGDLKTLRCGIAAWEMRIEPFCENHCARFMKRVWQKGLFKRMIRS